MNVTDKPDNPADHVPIPHPSQRTISLGNSELSFLHLMHMISVVVSSTAAKSVRRLYIMHTHTCVH